MTGDKPATEQDLLAIAQWQAEILGRAEGALIEAREVLGRIREDAAQQWGFVLDDAKVSGAISSIDRCLGEIAGSREVTKLGGNDAG